MTSINSINSTSAAASSLGVSKCNTISEETKKKLEALGLDPSSVTSEAEAQALITAAQEAQSQNNTGSQDKGGGKSSANDILTDTKQLAKEVGVSVADNDKIDDILDNISIKVSKMIAEAQCDPAKMKPAEDFQSRLSVLIDENESLKTSMQSMFTAMNMVSISNKLALGLS